MNHLRLARPAAIARADVTCVHYNDRCFVYLSCHVVNARKWENLLRHGTSLAKNSIVAEKPHVVKCHVNVAL